MPTFDDYLNQEPPPILYHYGGPDSLIGLVKGKSAWASNIHYLNDAREFSYAISLLDGIVEDTRKGQNSRQDLIFLEALLARIKQSELYSVYVYCLSEVDDLLSQWRGYTPAANGYCMGFRTELLRRVAAGRHFHLHPCIYDENDQREAIREIFTKQFEGYRKAAKRQPKYKNDLITNYVEAFRTLFIRRAPLIKHHGFREEREWRLVSPAIGPDKTPLHIRKSGSTLVPYYDLILTAPGEPFPLCEVIIGPTTHPHLTEKSLELLFRLNNIGGVHTRRSIIPYRTGI
jgi:hypothetical protein